MEKLTISVKELAAMLGISRPKAYELVRRADFPAIWLGRRVVVPMDGLKLWLSRQTVQGSSGQLHDVKRRYGT